MIFFIMEVYKNVYSYVIIIVLSNIVVFLLEFELEGIIFVYLFILYIDSDFF